MLNRDELVFNNLPKVRKNRLQREHLRNLVCRELTKDELAYDDREFRLYIKSHDDALLKRFRR